MARVRLPGPVVGCGLVVSVLWLAGCVWYIDFAVGWTALSYFLPQELAQFVIGASAPLIALWLGLLVATRRRAGAEQTKEIVTRVEALLAGTLNSRSGEGKLAESLRRETAALIAASDTAETKLAPLLAAIDKHNRTLAQNSQDLQTTLAHNDALLAGQNAQLIAGRHEAVGLGDELERLRHSGEALGAALKSEAEALSETGGQMVALTSAAADRLSQQEAGLNERLEKGLARGQALTAILHSEAGALDQLMADLETRGAGLASRLAKARDQLHDETEQLSTSGQIALTNTDAATAAYAKLAATLVEKDKLVVERIDAMGSALQARSVGLTKDAEAMAETVLNALTRLSREGSRIDETLTATQSVADRLREGIAGEEHALRDLHAKLSRTLEGLAVRFEAQTKLLDAASHASEATSQRFLAASDEEMERLRALQTEANEGLIELRHRLALSLGEFNGAIEQTKRSVQSLDQEVTRRTDRFETAMRESYATGAEMTEALTARAEDLSRIARGAEVQVQALKESQEQRQREGFLETATQLIEELNSLAIDMTSLLEGELPDEVWRRHRKGDRSAFARRLGRMRDPFSVSAVEKHYREDAQFRAKASHFMSQFEDLLSRANACDSDQVLNAAFLTADVGKVYLLLSRSLGREQ